MIDRFNFFDIYAYLLPGVAFLGLMWLPFGIVGGSWPSADLSSALFSLVAAYIVGHVLYYPAKAALPTGDKENNIASRRNPSPALQKPTAETGDQSGKKDAHRGAEKLIHPSEYLLDVKDPTFPESFKTGLEKLINDRSQGAVTVNIHLDWNNTDEKAKEKESEQRALAFLLCRSTLVTCNAASYGPQFEGLYQFLRCLTVVFALGFFYHMGWALALWAPIPRCVVPLAALAALAIVGAASLDRWGYKVYKQKEMNAWTTMGLLMLALLLCPFFLRLSIDPAKANGSYKVLSLAGIAFIDLFAGLRCSSGYKPFAKEFAEHIYRDFYAYAKGQAGRNPE